jgi:hypothetical protein
LPCNFFECEARDKEDRVRRALVTTADTSLQTHLLSSLPNARVGDRTLALDRLISLARPWIEASFKLIARLRQKFWPRHEAI